MVELVIFVLVGSVALGGAIAVVRARNPVYGAMGLMATLFALAVFYVVHLAHFVAAVQVIVYAGAVITLFLFVIMFVGVDRAERLTEKLAVQRPVALVVLVAVVVLAGVLVVTDRFDWVITADEAGEIRGTVEEIGTNLIAVDTPSGQEASRWLLPFEATSLLLIVAAVGAISLAYYRPRRKDVPDEEGAAADQDRRSP
jgi:NADH-quinone oxidoreductase subunit J